MEMHVFDYYLSLLQVQMAILGIVVAGLVALIQTLGAAVPKRQIKMLASPLELACFAGLLSVLLVILSIATWTTAFADASSVLSTFFTSKIVGIILLFVCLLGLVWFVYLIYRTKRLLNPQLYLEHHIATTSAHAVHEYVTTVYEIRATDHRSRFAAHNGFREAHDFRERLEYVDNLYDPFQPIREYVKDSAQNQFDYGTAAGLRLFGKLFDKSFTGLDTTDSKTTVYLAEHLASSSVEFFRVFHKASSEKRKLDVVRLIYAKGSLLLATRNDVILLIIVRALEEMGEVSRSEEEIVMLIECIQDLTNSYIELSRDASGSEVSDTFEQVCLSMTRLAESYYLGTEPTRTVPLVGYYSGRTRDVNVSFVNFFMSYRHLTSASLGVYPKVYFEAIKALCEALHSRINEINESGKVAAGLNRNYRVLTGRLYKVHEGFALEAIRLERSDLFALALGNLRRILQSADRFDLGDERIVIAKLMISLVVARSKSSISDAEIKGHTIVDYMAEVLTNNLRDEEIRIVFIGLTHDRHGDAVKELRARLLPTTE